KSFSCRFSCSAEFSAEGPKFVPQPTIRATSLVSLCLSACLLPRFAVFECVRIGREPDFPMCSLMRVPCVLLGVLLTLQRRRSSGFPATVVVIFQCLSHSVRCQPILCGRAGGVDRGLHGSHSCLDLKVVYSNVVIVLCERRDRQR
ncbi:unnamed protein product, partial [Soboliphyme baturini]|uniref:Secreted protein n=1 Tax=Soboliphyme baturini TaxID=241478 RepID=A0A183IWY9_9BILA